MKNHKWYEGAWVAPGTKLFELLESKKPEDAKLAKRLAKATDERYYKLNTYEVCQKTRQDNPDLY